MASIKPISELPNLDPNALTLVNHLNRVLEKVVGVFESYGVPLPARRYWMLNQPAEDCEQVVVSFLQAYLGAPGDQAAEAQSCNGSVPRTGVLNVQISRNHPEGENGRAVRPERIMEASEWGAVDAWVLMQALAELDASEDGFVGPGVVATVNVNAPSGGLQTTVLNISQAIL